MLPILRFMLSEARKLVAMGIVIAFYVAIISSTALRSGEYGGGNNAHAPAASTADGVRELQNRRVEVTYGPGSGN